ncbi:hypothetical protein C8R47DRAFT_1071910 [Mycena vitilis]|nr:hypothetical protein C8R47DRAFT_1071910 [Mycena vitilis]
MTDVQAHTARLIALFIGCVLYDTGSDVIDAFIDFKGPGGALAFYGTANTENHGWKHWLPAVEDSAQVMLGDALLIYRCYVLYDRNWRAVAPPVVSWMALVATSMTSSYREATLPEDLIVRRLVWIEQQPHLRSTIRPHILTRIATIFFETGLIYTLSVVASLGVYLSRSNLEYVAVIAMIHIITLQPITCNLLLIRFVNTTESLNVSRCSAPSHLWSICGVDPYHGNPQPWDCEHPSVVSYSPMLELTTNGNTGSSSLRLTAGFKDAIGALHLNKQREQDLERALSTSASSTRLILFVSLSLRRSLRRSDSMSGAGVYPRAAQIPLDDIVGAWLIGLILSAVLFGVTCIQVYLYFTQYCTRDPAVMKLFYNLQRSPILVIMFDWANRFDPSAIGFLLSALGKLFYAFRVYMISNKRPAMPILIAITAFAVCGTWPPSFRQSLAFLTRARPLGLEIAFTRNTLFQTQGISEIPYPAAAISLGVSCDVFVAVAMVYYLLKNKTEFQKTTNKAINLLFSYCVSSGALTMVFAICCLVLLVRSTTMLFTLFFFITVRLYGLSFMTVSSQLTRTRPQADVLQSSNGYASFGWLKRARDPGDTGWEQTQEPDANGVEKCYMSSSARLLNVASILSPVSFTMDSAVRSES